MTVDRLTETLNQMREAAEDAIAFTSGLSEASFLTDKRTQRAVIMSLLIVGEAATQVLDRFPEHAARHPEIPWRAMRGMRSRIAHGYFDLDLAVVWSTIKDALPDLVDRLRLVG